MADSICGRESEEKRFMADGKFVSSRRGFLQSLGATGLGMAGINATVPRMAADSKKTEPIRPGSEIFVGNHRQLLFDDFFLGAGDNLNNSYPYGIRWSLGKVIKSPDANIFHVKEPWEDTTAWFCVLHDGGLFRMWYSANKQPRKGLFVCYAESDDGLTWRKPILNLIEMNGSKRNNIVYTGGPGAWHVELGNVFRDSSAKPEERYKMIYPTWLGAPGEDGVTLGAYSSDGLHWTRSRNIFVARYCDSQNVATYDSLLGKYVAYVRWGGESYGALGIGERPVRGASRGRSVGRMESNDYAYWSSPELVLTPDFEDGLNVQFYGPAYSRYPEADTAHFMFPPAYHQREGTFLTQVAVSRDNRTWLRPTRETFIPLGPPGSFDQFIISVSPGFLPAGKDQYALYYRSGNGPHPGVLQRFVPKNRTPHSTMGRVVFKRDRIVGIEAGAEGGGFWTRPLLFEGRKLVLNAEPTGPGSRLEVQLVGVGANQSSLPHWARGEGVHDAPCPGYTFKESIPLLEDQLDGPVRWKGRTEMSEWAGKPVRLQFRLWSMRLYAFQFLA